MVYRGKDKPVVEIRLTDGQQDAFIPSYSSLDQIQGNVSVAASVDTKVEQVFITFEGGTRTYVEKTATTAPTNDRLNAYHTFVRLVQPMDDAIFPESGIFKAGETYNFPFIFAVPDRLLPSSCTHQTENDTVHQAHLQPPPTLGDPLTAVWGKSLMDDMSPDMAVVSWCIRVRVTSVARTDNKPAYVADDSKKIRVVPAVPEHPPIVTLGGKEDEYRLRKEKCIKKGTFKKRLGTMVMESTQPRSLRLPPPGTDNPASATTSALVNVRFDPAYPGAQPPRLETLVTKLKVATFYATSPMTEIPHRSSDYHFNPSRSLFVESVPLSSRCMASAQWDMHTSPTSPPRRHSAVSTIHNPKIPDPSSSYKEQLPYYSAHLVVPITLPRKENGTGSNKIFVPTFHTCLLSRIYVLDMILSCLTPDPSITIPTMRLKLPIQISAEGSPDASPSISEDEAQAIAQREAEEFTWQPRSLVPPSPEDTEPGATRHIPGPSSPPYTEGTFPGASQAQRSGSMGSPQTESMGERTGNVRAHTSPLPDYSVRQMTRPNVSSPTLQ
ncbi:MAG: hypothetical protein LQ346_000123 [Caloplaca aetnensis]|nr:MAG: hypothetical protein LQ346_000123 [Caloplaca aetnensis]